MITVAVTVSCQRRAYLDRTLRSWRRVRGVDEAGFLLCLEHYLPFRKGEARAAELERKFDGFESEMASVLAFPHALVYRNTTRLGCLRNTQKALTLGFNFSDFVVVAEEDIEVADDVLEYFTWASEHFRGDQGVLAVCAHSVASEGGPGEAAAVPWFTPLVWGTWRDRWDATLLPAWKPAEGYPEGWDYQVRQLVSPSLRCAYPAQSRAQHFGSQSTMTHGSPVTGSNYFHDRSQSLTFHSHYDPQDYREVLAVRGLRYY